MNLYVDYIETTTDCPKHFTLERHQPYRKKCARLQLQRHRIGRSHNR